MRKIAIFLSLLLTLHITSAQAIVVSRITTFEPHTKIESEDVNAEFDNILNAINGNLETENFLTGSVATASLATGSVTSEKISDGAVIAGKLGTSAVATANIASYAVTPSKMASANMVESIGTGALLFSGTSVGQAATVNITTFGRPILAEMVSANQSVNCSGLFSSTASYVMTAGAELSWDWQLDGATNNTAVFGGGSDTTIGACDSIRHVFRVPAGTYQIKLNFLNVGTTGRVCNCKLFVQEL